MIIGFSPPTFTWTGLSHRLDGNLLVLQHTGFFLRIEESSRWELVHLIARVRYFRHFTLYHLLDCLARGAVKLHEREGEREGERERERERKRERERERERGVSMYACVCVSVQVCVRMQV